MMLVGNVAADSELRSVWGVGSQEYRGNPRESTAIAWQLLQHPSTSKASSNTDDGVE